MAIKEEEILVIFSPRRSQLSLDTPLSSTRRYMIRCPLGDHAPPLNDGPRVGEPERSAWEAVRSLCGPSPLEPTNQRSLACRSGSKRAKAMSDPSGEIDGRRPGLRETRGIGLTAISFAR